MKFVCTLLTTTLMVALIGCGSSQPSMVGAFGELDGTLHGGDAVEVDDVSKKKFRRRSKSSSQCFESDVLLQSTAPFPLRPTFLQVPTVLLAIKLHLP